MKIGGFLPFSLIDYPGYISAVVFTQGCNFRCPYCHNPELVDPMRYGECIGEGVILSFLEKRRGRLDGVTITGGEPTVHGSLPALIRTIKEMGYAVKLDTNGTNPEMLQDLIAANLIDYIAMDVKGPLALYSRIAGVPVALNDIRRSISMIIRASCAHEFRTTVVPDLMDEEDIRQTATLVQGAHAYVLQPFQPDKTLDGRFSALKPPTEARMEFLKGCLTGGAAIHVR
ncbi:MAG: anaerobic ribonucleoside-triphosphate reductase activating protein [Syntrophaceae bacterium]|nr:anaerobic ribonucleoside-triphosphate reductase activating protein [Syntrophaceae bacterium]